MKKRLRLKKSVKETMLVAASLYALIVVGVIAINFRLDNLGQTKSADESVVQTAHSNN